MAGQARASYPEKMQKNDQTPPSKKSIIPRESQTFLWWWPSVYNYFLEKNWDIGTCEPTHQHTSRHADTPTRRHADTPTRRPRTRGTHTANTHTGRGLEGGDGRAERWLGGRDDSQHRKGGWTVETTANTGKGLRQSRRIAANASRTVRWRFDARSTHMGHWHGTAGFSDGCCGFHSGPSPCAVKHRFSLLSS